MIRPLQADHLTHLNVLDADGRLWGAPTVAADASAWSFVSKTEIDIPNWCRRLQHKVFDPIHDRLADLEDRSIASALIDPITPHTRTGWVSVEIEIDELRRHLQSARTPQDYRAVGLDCVAVIEALSATVYDPAQHLHNGEEVPPVTNTKQRLDRMVEDALLGPDNAALRKLARSVIEFAQQVKHSGTPTRREAGIAADAVIQLANLLRRLQEPV
jgi:hypothetical protein